MQKEEMKPLYKLEALAARLRAPNGCPWDREQTHHSLRPYLIEEVYEVLDALDSGNPLEVREELGDLLLQIYLHAEIAKEQGAFSLDEVAETVIEKMILRHPHVFGDAAAKDAQEVLERWEQIKKKEKPHRESILDGVPKDLPALLKAYRIQEKVSRVGFAWEKREDIPRALQEEVERLKEAMALGDSEKIVEEAGDMLFRITDLLHTIKVNPEEALRKSIGKFVAEFKAFEKKAASSL